ncbi:hypothetical protein ATEIFO6365_0004002600 [Aspergillus terreus]|uniref:Uncharacterized protein n=1 Tax=Aspergillus terreus TaxID=33178 RepID=A0A5M3YND1_ASPTE|nr:hypothetical protein ATETN484_0002012500 [Aspergillus terreus]GFF14908.1 hypothetical protein ATEIFO6365_0004002600 [Aspergillus terreus]
MAEVVTPSASKIMYDTHDRSCGLVPFAQAGPPMKPDEERHDDDTFKKEIMSAPYPGRQSPDPETQSNNQQAPLTSGKTTAEFREESKNLAQKGTQNLTSNPEHPLEKIEAAKFSKGPGN